MTYPYTENGGGDGEAEDAGDGLGVAGACPPFELRYRIYPEADFDQLLGNPPPTVVT